MRRVAVTGFGIVSSIGLGANEVIEKLIPLILNQVESVADGPELIAFGTANGPIRLTPLARAISAASTMAWVEGPPEPTTRPVFSSETSASVRPESAIA